MFFYNRFSKKETPLSIETEVHDTCLQVINGTVEDLRKSPYYLTNPKLEFLTDLLQRLVQQREGARGKLFFFQITI